MDEAPRTRGDEGYGACFDDMRAADCNPSAKRGRGPLLAVAVIYPFLTLAKRSCVVFSGSTGAISPAFMSAVLVIIGPVSS
jgi:hypothetical protein